MIHLPFSDLKYIFSISLLVVLFVACDSEEIDEMEQNITTTEVRHGYIYIGCQGPPYYLKLDSMKTHCSMEGALPDTLPEFTWGPPAIDTYCGTYLDQDYANVDDHDIAITYNSTTVDIQSTIPDASLEALPEVNIDGNIFQTGEHPYLGGLQISTDSLEATIQVVNVYIGGCFHNMIVWSSED